MLNRLYGAGRSEAFYPSPTVEISLFSSLSRAPLDCPGKHGETEGSDFKLKHRVGLIGSFKQHLFAAGFSLLGGCSRPYEISLVDQLSDSTLSERVAASKCVAYKTRLPS